MTCWSTKAAISLKRVNRARTQQRSSKLIGRLILATLNAVLIISSLIVGFFYAEKQHSSNIFPFGARVVNPVMPHHII